MTEKTYSGIQSYHEMLLRAQARSPALTYAMVVLLTDVEIKPKEVYQESEKVNARGGHDFSDYFRDVYPSVKTGDPRTIMQTFLHEMFGDYAVRGTRDGLGEECRLIAETQFVEWLKTDVVVVDKEKRLVTITI